MMVVAKKMLVALGASLLFLSPAAAFAQSTEDSWLDYLESMLRNESVHWLVFTYKYNSLRNFQIIDSNSYVTVVKARFTYTNDINDTVYVTLNVNGRRTCLAYASEQEFCTTTGQGTLR
ncbi:MAG: hypothetical protein EOP61_09785 [Sphingomonadales bacterium]|nr:MAG: hypothetical protein EOP61_09785 [Sphingomonadales bacterium]